MEENLDLKDVISGVLADYFNTYNINPFPINISIVDDMWKAYIDLKPDQAEADSEIVEFQRNNNGSMVPPNEIDGIFTILLNKTYIMDSIQKGTADWLGTFVHEAVHVNDFIQFVKLVGAANYNIVLDRTEYRMFHLWTEFNAKAKGYYFLRKYTFEDIQDESQLRFICETELPFQIRTMFENYNSTNNGDKQMYYVVHFVGRLHILQKLFPRYFTNKEIKRIFGVNRWMYELYTFLSIHTKLEDAYRNFDSMKEILKQNFFGLD